MIGSIVRPSAWPVVVKVPLLVALLMVAIGVALTDLVLKRLVESQERHFNELTAAYLDGLSSSVIPAVLREDAWETFDNLDRARSLYRGLAILETVVASPDGTVLASSSPKSVPAYAAVPAAITERFGPGNDSWLDEKAERAGVRRILMDQGRPIGAIYALFDVGERFRERQSVLWTLLVTSIVVTLTVATAGLLLVRRLLRPVRLLTQQFSHGVSGQLPLLSEHEVGPERSEFGQLFRHFNKMVQAWNEREVMAARMAEDERLASLGRLASGMAHEINNPLGGLFNAIETLKRHGSDAGVRERAISLLERGLTGIRDVVRSALVTYRADAAKRPLKPVDIEDLRLLIAPEAERRNLILDWRNDLAREIPLEAGAMRQAVLNLLLNACQASPQGGYVEFRASHADGTLVIRVADRGRGLDLDRVRYLEDRAPVEAPRPGESGLGLWIVRRLIHEAGGSIDVEAVSGKGTAITVTVPDTAAEDLRHVA
jgi:signal transduction histidine kinase